MKIRVGSSPTSETTHTLCFVAYCFLLIKDRASGFDFPEVLSFWLIGTMLTQKPARTNVSAWFWILNRVKN